MGKAAADLFVTGRMHFVLTLPIPDWLEKIGRLER